MLRSSYKKYAITLSSYCSELCTHLTWRAYLAYCSRLTIATEHFSLWTFMISCSHEGLYQIYKQLPGVVIQPSTCWIIEFDQFVQFVATATGSILNTERRQLLALIVLTTPSCQKINRIEFLVLSLDHHKKFLMVRVLCINLHEVWSNNILHHVKIFNIVHINTLYKNK